MVLLIRFVNIAALLFALYIPYDMYTSQQNWETGVYQEKQNQKSEKENQLAQKKAEVKRADDFKSQRDAKIEALRQLRLAVDEQANMVPKRANLRDVLKALADRADATGLEFSRFVPSSPRSLQFLVLTPVNVELRGTYTQVMSFLDAAANMERAVTTENLVLKPNTNPRSGVSIVSATATLVTYHLDETRLSAQGAPAKKEDESSAPTNSGAASNSSGEED